ncbi:hypothetical protein [Rubrivirga sp.]|uniref:hypothetical protein n=1 Tax=Rubrivirga sp. TaxID=1885344 RepID=UPI003C7959AE
MPDAPTPDPEAATTVTDGDPAVGLTTPGGPDRKSPWRWVPSLYFAEGLPYIIVMALAVILYKRLGMSNADIALYTSWLYLPWVIKPFWSPLVDVLKTKRWWIVVTQVLIGGGLAGVALTIPTDAWVQGTLAFFWLLAFSSATHDIAADGFYMLALDEHDQAWYVGIRSTFYRAAVIAASGLVPMLAGALEASTGLGAVDVPVEVVATSEEALPTPGANAAPAVPIQLTSVAQDTLGRSQPELSLEDQARIDEARAAARAQEDALLDNRQTQEISLDDLDPETRARVLREIGREDLITSDPAAAAPSTGLEGDATAPDPSSRATLDSLGDEAATSRTGEASVPLDGELRLLVENRAAEVPLALRDPAEIDALIAQVRAANQAAGFYATEDAAAAAAAAAADEGSSLWQRVVSEPLGRVIEAAFGEPAPEVSATAGNIGLVEFRLSGPPPAGEAVPVNFGFDDGDQSVKLVEGERFTFTDANWDTPFTAVVQLDPKLREPTSASFRATSGNIPLAWSISFVALAGLFLALMAWHAFALPRPDSDVPHGERGGLGGVAGYLVFLLAFAPTLLIVLVPMMIYGLIFPRRTGPWGKVFSALPFSDTPFAQTIVTFFQKPEIGIAIAFIVFYRFAEAQLVKLAAPFLLDSIEAGGLGLTTGEVGFVYGTVGVASLTIGGILGGIVAARDGLKTWLWPMVIAINAPNAVYLLLAIFEPQSFALINIAVIVEQFGYGFGFSALLLYAIYVADGPNKTAHYAIATGLWALGMMIPGMFSGWLQEIVGYERFFLWVLLATIPSFLVAARVHIDPEFGKKKDEPAAAS